MPTIQELSNEELEYLQQSVENSNDDELLKGVCQEFQIQTGWIPHPRQAEFLALDCEEAMVGGALGGGKTEVLLQWLKEGVQHPGFSGLFLRRTFSQLRGSPTTPIERSWKFFAPLGGVFNSTEKYWKFPNGAMVRFGHIQHESDVHNYDGHELHRICFDQVEQFSETQYQYLFSRLRRLKDYPIPCGMRSSANPIGGSWVKRRFVSEQAIQTLKQFTAYDKSPPGMMFTSDCGAVFVPSRVADNPSLAVREYIDRLRAKLGATLAAKLANGDWSAVEGAIIDSENLRYYTVSGGMIKPLDSSGNAITVINTSSMRRFATIDTAGTSAQKAREDRGANHSWSVCGIWDYSPSLKMLFLRHVWRQRVEWFDLKTKVAEVLRTWQVPHVIIEMAHHGQPLAAELRKECSVTLQPPVLSGMKTSGVPAEGAKHERAIASGLLGMIESGSFRLPDVHTVAGVGNWMPEFESELLGWTGRPNETSDQIDMCSYAANYTKQHVIKWGGVVTA